MSKIVIERQDILWSYLGSFFRLATNIILLPLILSYLTDSELGLWYVFATISQLVSLLDFGFAPALSRNISYVWCGAKSLSKENIDCQVSDGIDGEYFKKVLVACRYIYLLIAIISGVILLSFGTYYIFSLDPSRNTLFAWIIYTIGVFLNTLYSYYTSFLRGVGAVAENNKSGVWAKLIQICLSFLLLVKGYGLLGVSVAYLISGIVLRLCSKYYFYKYNNIELILEEIHIKNKFQETFNLLKVIWHNASRDGLVTLSNFLSTQANTLICSVTLGLTSTGAYGLSLQLATVIASLSGIPFSTYHPAMQEKAVRKDLKGSSTLYSTSMMLYIIMFILLSICLVLCLPILKYFKPDLDVDYIMLTSLLIQMLIYQIYQHAASYISTFNIIPYTKSFVISSIFSVIISFLLAKYTNIGIWALVLTPLIVSILYNAWKWPLVSLQKTRTRFDDFILLGIKGSKNYLKSIFR